MCGWTEELTRDSVAQSGTHCFDVEQVFANCDPVYIRVNFHFFVNDNCNGNLQVSGTPQHTATIIAKNLVNQANDALANNQIQWQMPGATTVCNPMRYVLRGVYTHCKTNATGGYSTPTLHNIYGVNTTSEINVYVANFPGGATGIGYPTYASIDWIETGNFNHEMGHVFSLAHNFMFDGCDDTPNLSHSWDRNCNGTIASNNETNRQCWNHIPADKLPGEPGFSDANGNGTHDCNEMPPCTSNPCCSWAYVDNNVMSYNTYESAWTECQVLKVLNHLNDIDCGFVENVGGCPPPSAFITQTPKDLLNTTYCSECLILNGSFNEDEYLLNIYEIVNEQEVLAYTSGWDDGPVPNFCFSTNSHILFSGNYLKPNKQYKVVLTVENYCGDEHSYEYLFTTPSSNCSISGDPSSPTEMRVNPNPGSDLIQIEFDGFANESFHLFATNNLSGNISILFQNYTALDGGNSTQINVYELAAGSYTLTLIGG
ncbi:MAG: hypothetical protein OHK0019_24970 [Saprospiraceae bacterium]